MKDGVSVFGSDLDVVQADQSFLDRRTVSAEIRRMEAQEFSRRVNKSKKERTGHLAGGDEFALSTSPLTGRQFTFLELDIPNENTSEYLMHPRYGLCYALIAWSAP